MFANEYTTARKIFGRERFLTQRHEAAKEHREHKRISTAGLETMHTSNALHQISNTDFKRISNRLNSEQRRIFQAAFDATQESPVNVGFYSELLL